MPREAFEMILLHFFVGAIGSPFVLRDSIDSRHYARSMPASLAVHIDRPIGRIVHEFQKLRDSGVGGPIRCC